MLIACVPTIRDIVRDISEFSIDAVTNEIGGRLTPSLVVYSGEWNPRVSSNPVSGGVRCSGDDQGKARGVHGRRYRHHHDDHGAGFAPTRRTWLRRPEATRTEASGLHTQFHLPGHLLEQPPPSDARGGAHRQPRPLGEHGTLFSLSLTPAATAWLGEHPRDTAPVVAYGSVLLASAVAYFVLTRTLLALHRDLRWPSPSGAIAKVGSRRSRT